MLKTVSTFVLLTLCALFAVTKVVVAQTSLGIGVVEQPPPSGGPFFWFFGHVHLWQQHFEKVMTQALIDVSAKPKASAFLIAVSFAYGIFHAIGPGHGKAVISSYLIANNETLQRGLILSLIASLLQALSAILIVFLVFYFLPVRWTTAANWLTVASFFLVALLGLIMLIKAIRKLISLSRCKDGGGQPPAVIAGDQSGIRLNASPRNRPQLIYKNPTDGHVYQSTTLCVNCGTTHLADPQLLSQPLNWRRSLTIILSVGLRPCTGALLVMSFAFVNRLYFAGLTSVLAMSLGTFLTVALLAIVAVKAKTFALKLAKPTKKTQFSAYLELIATFVVFLMGVFLLASSYY